MRAVTDPSLVGNMQVQPQESLGGRMVCPDQFTGAGRDRRGDSMLTKWCSQALPNAEEKSAGSPGSPGLIDGPVTFVLSTDNVDRHGDVVAADGWVLDSGNASTRTYLKNEGPQGLRGEVLSLRWRGTAPANGHKVMIEYAEEA